MTCNNEVLTLIKCADDMALVARLKDENTLSQYFDFINMIDFWFYESFLKLNITKTKELCIDSQWAITQNLMCPVEINVENVEQVDSFKYLGTVIDKKLSFSEHVDLVIKQGLPRGGALSKHHRCLQSAFDNNQKL